MAAAEKRTVRDPAGRTAELVAYDPAQAKQALAYDGRYVIVPTELIALGADGSLALRFDLSALDGAEAERLEIVLPVIVEEAVARKQRVETGRVRVSTHVSAEEALVEELLESEEVTVERVPVNRPLDAPAAVRREGETIIVPVMREILEIRKQLTLVEEVHIVKRKKTMQEAQQVTLRRQTVQIERLDGEQDSGA